MTTEAQKKIPEKIPEKEMSEDTKGEEAKDADESFTLARLIKEVRNDPMHLIYHGGQLTLLLGTSMTDMAWLRTFIITGNVCTMAFHLSRESPPYQAVFYMIIRALVSFAMLMWLLNERHGSLSFTEEGEAIYEAHFAGRGFSLRHFHKLLESGKRVELPVGEVLREPGEVYNNVMLVTKGMTEVKWDQDDEVLVSRSGPGWMGEMGYLTRLNRDDGGVSAEGPQSSEGKACSTVVRTISPCTVYVWEDQDLQNTLSDTVMQQKFLTLLASESRRRTTLQGEQKGRVDQYYAFIKGMLIDGRLQAHQRTALESFRCEHNISDDDHLSTIRRLGWTKEEWIYGAQDTTFVSDVQRELSNQEYQQQQAGDGAIVFNGYSRAHGELASYFPVGFTDDSGEIWRSVEHYYQAQKFRSPENIEKLRDVESPADVGTVGRRLKGMRRDWRKVREEVLLRAMRWKFAQDQHCREVLLGTGSRRLVLGHNDSFWGSGPDGQGNNRFGELLVTVREEILREEAWMEVEEHPGSVGC